MTYTTLIDDKDVDGSLKNWVNYALVPAAFVLTLAQAYVYERLRVREMRVETEIAIADGDSEMDIPDRFLAPVDILLDGDSVPLEFLHENLFQRFRDIDTGELSDGTIASYTIMNETIMFDVASDAARAGRFWFYQTPAALSADNPTNFLTVRYPSLLLNACTVFANEHRKLYAERDKGMIMLEAAIHKANEAADLGRLGQTLR